MSTSKQTPGKQKLCLPFRISVSLAFTLISAPLLLAVIGTLYVRNVQLARELAAEIIDRATTEISDHVEGLFNPLVRVVDTTASLGSIDPDWLRKRDALQYLFTVLESTPHAEMLYVGFARDGAFYQVRRLSSGVKKTSADDEVRLNRARFALRTIDPGLGKVTDSTTYIAKWGQVITSENNPALYDPRRRPWYLDAWKQPGLSISDVYIFFTTGEPGLTLSRRIATRDDTPVGTVGIDIPLGELSQFMARQRIGDTGVAFIIDNNGHLIGYPKLETIVRRKGSEISISKASEIDDPRVVEALKLREQGAGDRFSAELGDGMHLVSFTRLPERFGKDWLIGVVAAENDFVGPIRRASLFILALGSSALLFSIFAIFYVSKTLTLPLKRVVNETKRIRDFELGGRLPVSSRIIEINEVARALDAMEAGLRSFGAYIPKALVRTIVASGKGTGIGGERRKLTILFSDIKDFTRRSEVLSPEEVFDQLSAHFTAISRCIFDHGGTVDKFIGDSVMAFWNAPVVDPDHASDACHAVLRCQAVLEKLNIEFEAKGFAAMRARFGLHTGDVVVGNVGSADRMQYTALGAEVNMASRVEALNKRYGTWIIATGTVEEQVRDQFLFRPIDLVVPAGTTQIVPLFELLGTSDDGPDRASDNARALCREWSDAIAAYRRRDWDDALIQFRCFAARYPKDNVAPIYIERCSQFSVAPPPYDWDGAEHFETK